jgi:hypothetical protein
MGVATEYCVFCIQDTTLAGAARALPRIFCTDANKAAAQALITCSTAAGATAFDALIVAPHTIVDVGPVVNGNTRGATALYNLNYTGPAASNPFSAFGYRSLHRTVTFTVALGNPTVDVVVTHRLNNANTVAFVSPSLDPIDSGAVGDIVKVWQTATAADTITLRMGLGSGGNFVGNTTVTFDVMVLVRSTVMGSLLTGREHTIGGVAGAAYSDDYSGGATLARQVVGQVASYEALYTNADGIVVGGVALTHNMGSATGAMALIGAVASPGLGVPVITNNATSTTTMTIARQGADMDNNIVYIVRPYSIFIPDLT